MTYTDAVAVRSLTVDLGGTPVLRDLDLTLGRGVHALLGQNGAGKTTLVRVLSTLLPPTRGEARVFGHHVVHDASQVRRRIGLTGQYPSVDELLTGSQNLVLTGRLLGLGRRTARARAAELLERFDLPQAAGRRVSTWSGGMRRRLDLASALVRPPALLILDEPTTGLDTTSRSRLWQEVRDLAADGTTVLLTTQYLEEADALADHVWVLHRGRIVADGTCEELKDQVGVSTLEVRTHAGRLVRTAAVDAGIRATADAIDSLAPWADALGDVERDGLRITLRRPTLDEVFVALTADRQDERVGHDVAASTPTTAREPAQRVAS